MDNDNDTNEGLGARLDPCVLYLITSAFPVQILNESPSCRLICDRPSLLGMVAWPAAILFVGDCGTLGVSYSNFGLFQHLDLVPLCRSHYTNPSALSRNVTNQSSTISAASPNVAVPASSNQPVLPALDDPIVDITRLAEDDDVPLPPYGNENDDEEVTFVDLLDACSSVSDKKSAWATDDSSANVSTETMPPTAFRIFVIDKSPRISTP